jgi:hydrogenase maturation protease
MTDDFESTLAEICIGATAFVSVGNKSRADDGAGAAVCALLREAGIPHVYDGDTTPERLVPVVRDGGFKSVVFFDAVDAGLEAGAVVLMDAQKIRTVYPQVSTHKLSLSSIASLITDDNDCSVWLVGIQPETICLGVAHLSDAVENTTTWLAQRIATVVFADAQSGLQEHVCI